MNWLEIHLAVNHIAVIGLPFVLLLLGWGWARRTENITRLAVWWILILSVISIALKFTGDFAAEQAGPKLDPVRTYVNAHEQSADQATTAIFVLALVSAATLFLARHAKPVPAWSKSSLLLIGLATCVLLARTANLGGQIAHPELR